MPIFCQQLLIPSLRELATDVHFLVVMNPQSGQALEQKTLKGKVWRLTFFLPRQVLGGREELAD
jgi:cell division inhibitor SulA